MPKKKVTKIDPRKELSPYLNHQSEKNKRPKKKMKVSASLSGLNKERHHALIRRLGLIILFAGLAIIFFAYYISPLANVGSIKVEGATDLPVKSVVIHSGVSPRKKIINYLFNERSIDKQLRKKYPEVKHVHLEITHFNQLILQVNEYKTVGYVKEGQKYRKLLINGRIGSQFLNDKNVSLDHPRFVNYKNFSALKMDFKAFEDLPSTFRQQVKLLDGKTARSSQIILIMKNGNVVIGNVVNLKQKIKFYPAIKAKAGKYSLIDLEVGAWSRPLTAKEKTTYGIS